MGQRVGQRITVNIQHIGIYQELMRGHQGKNTKGQQGQQYITPLLLRQEQIMRTLAKNIK